MILLLLHHVLYLSILHEPLIAFIAAQPSTVFPPLTYLNLTLHLKMFTQKKKKKHAELDDSLAGDDVFYGYIRGAVCGQRYLSRTDFSDCQLPVIKLKMHSCQARQKMWPCEAARSEETPFGPSSRTSETGTDRHTQPTRRLPSKQYDLSSSPCPSHHPPTALFFIAVKGWIVSETEETQSTQCSAIFFLFFFKEKQNIFLK